MSPSLRSSRIPIFCFALVILVGTGASAAEKDYGKVELIRDQWGTPHIFASSDEGAMYGLGYATAQDRLYQMNLHLRLMQGRLAEVVGDLPKRRQRSYGPNSAAEEDRLMRTIGFARHAKRVVENLDADTRALLRAYCEGVNDYLGKESTRLHPLFEAQGWRPEPWTEADCLLSWWQVARFFSSDGLRDLWSLRQRDNPMRAMMQRSKRVVDDEAAVVHREDVSDEWVEATERFLRSHGLMSDAADRTEEDGPKFSHAWVLGGALTTTGSSVLVSDPQTPVWNPSLFHEFHVVGKSFNARGIGVPGSPLILIGFNPDVAWGLTALGADQADLFLLTTDSDHPNQYELDGTWEPMAVRQETILVADGEPIDLTVRETQFGPVVSEFALGRRREAVALKRIPLAEDDRDTIQAAIAMMRAGSAAEFHAALADWRFPTANCIFGDREGSIGYSSIGAIPVRSAGSPRPNQAHDGSTTTNDWLTYVPHGLLPHVIDPERGYLVTANHRTIQSFYQLTLGTSTGSAGDTDRGWRIKQRIAAILDDHAGEKVHPEEMLDVQSDSVNATKRAVFTIGYHLRDRLEADLSESAVKALAHMETWFARGARSDMSEPGTELANAMPMFFREMAVPLAGTYGGGVSGLVLAMKTLTARIESEPETPFNDQEIAFVDGALAGAWEACVDRYGSDSSLWHALSRRAGQATRLGYMESLAGYPSLDARWDIQRPLLRVQDGATILAQPGQAYTQYVPMHDPDAALSILPPGPSEDPASPFRFSNISAWAGGRLHPAPLSREAVEAIAVQQEVILGQERRPTRREGAVRNERTRESARPTGRTRR